MIIRAFEEMILPLQLEAYELLNRRESEYRGPTHLSIGQEATNWAPPGSSTRSFSRPSGTWK